MSVDLCLGLVGSWSMISVDVKVQNGWDVVSRLESRRRREVFEVDLDETNPTEAHFTCRHWLISNGGATAGGTNTP